MFYGPLHDPYEISLPFYKWEFSLDLVSIGSLQLLTLICRPELTEGIILPHILCEATVRHGFKVQSRPKAVLHDNTQTIETGLKFPISIPLIPITSTKDHHFPKL